MWCDSYDYSKYRHSTCCCPSFAIASSSNIPGDKMNITTLSATQTMRSSPFILQSSSDSIAHKSRPVDDCILALGIFWKFLSKQTSRIEETKWRILLHRNQSNYDKYIHYQRISIIKFIHYYIIVSGHFGRNSNDLNSVERVYHFTLIFAITKSNEIGSRRLGVCLQTLFIYKYMYR